MHIPDGFLSPPVWLAMDLAAIPAVGLVARKAQGALEESSIPLLGVMGAFVFAAQMINFPVGPGTSGHLVGAALLAYLLGPWAAAMVMTSILAIQSLVFQDGGILALGANVWNMAMIGVLAAWLPYHSQAVASRRKAVIFTGAFLSVICAGCLALAELLISGLHIPAPVLAVALALFAVSAAIEGGITVAIIQAIEKIHPGWIQAGASGGKRTGLMVVGAAALVLAVGGVLVASSSPDGLERLIETAGLSSRGRALISTPLSGYEWSMMASEWLRKALAGLAGLVLIYGLCLLLGRGLIRRRSS
ncbi:MAG: energy-coupling factor ABC transporter permease [Bryobacterales bacterium]|nr:energy-coupling factor ABC transporter permease [Bryobacterales bacterium]